MMAGTSNPNSGQQDVIYNQVVEFVQSGSAITACQLMLNFDIGFNRAYHLLKAMEDAGVISKMSKSGKHSLLRDKKEKPQSADD